MRLMRVAFMSRFTIFGVHAFDLRCADVRSRLIDMLRRRHGREQQAQADEGGEHQSECRMEMFQHNKTGGLVCVSGGSPASDLLPCMSHAYRDPGEGRKFAFVGSRMIRCGKLAAAREPGLDILLLRDQREAVGNRHELVAGFHLCCAEACIKALAQRRHIGGPTRQEHAVDLRL